MNRYNNLTFPLLKQFLFIPNRICEPWINKTKNVLDGIKKKAYALDLVI
jgi:hypothetical protein